MTNYLSTLAFSDGWLQALRRQAPHINLRQIPAVDPTEIPSEVWAEVEVLHTAGGIPDPAIAPRLRWVQLDTAGIDHLAGHRVWEAEVAVTTLGGVSPVPMAEYVMMMVLAWSHRLPLMLELQRERVWPSREERWERLMPERLPGRTVAIVGYGRIGREIGRIARAFQMEVIGVTRSGRGEPGDVEVVGVERLGDVLARSQVIVVVTPLTPQTRGLLGGDALARLAPGSILIDVARGGVVDEPALLAALDDGRLGFAALDVFAKEPLPIEHPLWRHPRVVVSPHVAGFAPTYEADVLELVADNLRRLAEGRALRNLVDRERGY